MLATLLFANSAMAQSANHLIGAIAEVNYPPVGNPQQLYISTLQPLQITLAGYDANGDTLTFSVFTYPLQGTLTLLDEVTGQVTYEPGPGFSGSDSFTFQVSDGGLESEPRTVRISWVGAVATLPVSSLSFEDQIVGTTSAPQTVTLSNTGQAALIISNIIVDGDFAQTNDCGVSVPVGASCTITVNFKPTALGIRTGTLTITDNASDSPQLIDLSGAGTDVPLVGYIRFGEDGMNQDGRYSPYYTGFCCWSVKQAGGRAFVTDQEVGAGKT